MCSSDLRENEKVFIKDLGSKNGTFLNGKKLEIDSHELRFGDVIKLGPVEFSFELSEALIISVQPQGIGFLQELAEIAEGSTWLTRDEFFLYFGFDFSSPARRDESFSGYATTEGECEFDWAKNMRQLVRENLNRDRKSTRLNSSH